MELTESGLPDSQKGFEEALQLIEAFKEMATKVIEDLIRKPAENKTYNYHVYHAPVYNYHGMPQKDPQDSSLDLEEEPPSPSDMAAACEQTLEEGLWWGDASWGTAYQIFLQKGYDGGIDQFVRDVENWPFEKLFVKKCNKYSVGNPARKGTITWSFEKWRENGAAERQIKLGKRLLEILKGKGKNVNMENV